MNKTGYLYVAIGQKYIDEAIRSASSLKSISPSSSVTIVADRDINNNCFDHVIIEKGDANDRNTGLLYKSQNIYLKSPYEYTLFVDTDTYFYEDCQGLFDVLDYCDLAITIDYPDVARPKINDKPIKPSPIHNTGVILFKKNQANQELFANWSQIFADKIKNSTTGIESDQTSFTEAWLMSASKMLVIGSEWNLRIGFPQIVSGGKIKIVHGRSPDYINLQKRVNTPTKLRFWNPRKGRCQTTPNWRDRIRQKFREITKNLSQKN